MDVWADLCHCYLHMAETGFLMKWLVYFHGETSFAKTNQLMISETLVSSLDKH